MAPVMDASLGWQHCHALINVTSHQNLIEFTYKSLLQAKRTLIELMHTTHCQLEGHAKATHRLSISSCGPC
jgi:hypothetical protein